MPQVDYAALAAQHGGKAAAAPPPPPVVDYAALARETGGIPSEPVRTRPRGLATIGEMVGDLGGGLRSSAANLMLQSGDLIRRGLGMERIIDRPENQAAMKAPESLAGTVGRGIGDAAQFAVPLTKVAKAAKGLSLARRVGTEALASAGVAGVQSGGDPQHMTGAAILGGALPVAGSALRSTAAVVKRTAARAQEGGIGGAIAGAVRTVAPQAPKAMLVQALKPSAGRVDFEKMLDLALPELKATEKALGKPIQTVDELIAATKAAKQRVRAEYDAIAGPKREAGSTVDLTPVADAMAKSIPRKVQLENPERAAAMIERAGAYARRFSLEDAETLLKETNAELESFYAKFPAARRKALLADPEVAALDAQAKGLRDAIYRTLDAPGQGEAARAINRRYGALLDVEDVAYRRSNVAKRQQPESLAEQIGKARAYGDIAKGTWRVMHGDLTGAADIAGGHATRKAATFMKEQQTTDALIRRALQLLDAGKPKP